MNLSERPQDILVTGATFYFNLFDPQTGRAAHLGGRLLRLRMKPSSGVTDLPRHETFIRDCSDASRLRRQRFSSLQWRSIIRRFFFPSSHNRSPWRIWSLLRDRSSFPCSELLMAVIVLSVAAGERLGGPPRLMWDSSRSVFTPLTFNMDRINERAASGAGILEINLVAYIGGAP